VINFFDWPLSPDKDDLKKPKGSPYASDYPDCLEIVERLVKPERAKVKSNAWREKWWQYGSSGEKLYEAITDIKQVLAVAAVSRTVAFSFLPKDIVYAHKLIIFSLEEYFYFVVLQSSFHYYWAWKYSSKMKADLNYFPSDVFETFPFPTLTPAQETTLNDIGKRYYQNRQAIMTATQQGLTKTYNRFHDPTETDPDIQTLRTLHVEMDQAVCAAYGWDDLLIGEGLNHDFHDTKQGLRFTISDTARREILDRLLQLNHQRYAEEVKQGLHNKKGKKKPSKPKQTVPKDPTITGFKY
jgi:hypothetical protein